MNLIGRLFRKLNLLVKRRQFNSDLEEEMAFHHSTAAREFEFEGLSPEAARYAAMRRFGNNLKFREESHAMVGFKFESMVQDVRYAARQLWNNPGFTIVITLTLALSIGANSAIFSVVNAVLLKSLPYPESGRLMRLFLSSDAFPEFPLNPWDFHDFRERNKSFESIAAYVRADAQLSGSGEPIRISGFGVTAGYFATLGLQPQIGREFDRKAEIPGNEKQVILSDQLWRSRFAADPKVLGQKITLDMEPYTVVGVMPPGTEHPGNSYRSVAYGNTVDLWRPFPFGGNPAQRGSHFLDAIGRLKPGIPPEQAKAELNAIMTQLAREHESDRGWSVLVHPLSDEIVGSNRRMLWILLGAVGMVLLIACANAANLLLARAASRQREVAVRLALGAPRWRLIRQMMTESLLISLLGGTLGLTFAIVGIKTLVSLLPQGFPRAEEVQVSAPVFVFTFLVSVFTGLLFGLAPAFHASRLDPRQGLADAGRSATGSRRQQRLRNLLVISEISLACLLLIGAGLMLRSFLNQLKENPGFRAQHVLTASIALPEAAYQDEPTNKDASSAGGDLAAPRKKNMTPTQFFNRLLAGVEALPGVESAGIGSDLPWTGYNDNAGFTIEGKQPPPHEEFHARYHTASPNYFSALGIPLIKGRFFNSSDGKDVPNSWIINQSLAGRYWPHEDAVGKRITFADHPRPKDWFTIVGIVGDVKDKPNSPSAEPAFWWALAQESGEFPQVSLVVRSESDPHLLADAIRDQVKRLDPALAVADIQLMDRIADAGVATPRLIFSLVGLFAALAIVLAAIGIYGVIAYSVNQRIPEFGLRLALGAPPSGLMRMVLRQATRLAVVGTLIGLVAAFALARVVGSLIYGVSATDPATFATVGMLVLAVAMLACLMPALRATKADPMVALRAE